MLIIASAAFWNGMSLAADERAIGPAGTPAGTLIEAEAKLPSGDTKVVEDSEASGGKAISVPRDWQPLLKASVPPGEAFTIWVRYRSAPVLVKGTPDGKQQDLKWLWDKPAKLTWMNAGRYTRAALGDTVLVIRGGGGGEGPVLDAVVLAPDAATGAAVPVAATGAETHPDAPPVEAAVALGALNAPPGTLIEAEAHRLGGESRIVEVAGASGGKAVTSAGDWQPVFESPVPAGGAFKIWIRHQHGPLAVKTKVDGKTQDNWLWNRPEQFAWTDAGVYAREQLGDKLVIVRSRQGDGPDPLIDAVVFAPATVRPLPPFAPDPKLEPVTVQAAVDWNKIIGKMAPMMWGTNDYEILTPERAEDKGFQERLHALRLPLIRIHNAGFADRWTNEATRSWDVEKIKAGFAASTGYGDARIMLNVSGWPIWLEADHGYLPAEKHNEYVALVGQLAKILRAEVKQPIAYWELLNEKDNDYEKRGKLDELWSLYNKLAVEVKKQYPGAKIGGPALTWPKPEWVEGFLKNCAANADFISWHNYGTGDIFETNETLFGKAPTIAGYARGVKEAVARYAPARDIETFLSEFNVKWTWDPYERRHENNVGAVFMASTLRGVALT
ncbi:MAG: hypothetical protein M3347_08415, partial [Armatimonadota bacterium]|nr:hypothetical protein [Armatimonadota bacterium]